MLRSFFDFDAKLRSTNAKKGFVRYNSLSALPFDAFALGLDYVSDDSIAHYERMITRQLQSKFAVPTLTRSDNGQVVNCDEALEGISECYRHLRPVKSVLKLGLNISADHAVTGNLFAMRAAAIIAVFNLAKQRGQKVQFDICYGAFSNVYPHGYSRGHHIRITIPTPTVEIVKRVMSREFWCAVINHCCIAIGGDAMYQIWMIEKSYPQFGSEFDFALDRMETANEQIEYERIMKQIERLKT